jgi:MFS family permease
MSDPTTVTRTPKKAALAAWTGSALEYYDLAIYGTAAALVFPDIFFPEGNDSAATVAAFATFGVAYVARPIGSFLMGHIGDRLGRKKVLIGTLLLMGVSTFLVGCLPTYSQVGLLAPTLLVVLRLLQGLSAAGEQAGANSMSFEHAPDDRRGFFTSFTLSGTQGGQVLAPAVFLPLAAVLPEEQLLSWGWRVPFWISALVVVVGFVIRRSLDETPAFQAEADSGEVPRAPLGVLFGDHWRGVLRVFLAAFIAMVNTMFQIFALNFATSDDYEIGFSDTFMLWLAIVANLVAIAVIPFWARLSDRVGRKQVFVTGMAIGTQFGFALAGFTPTIAGALMGGETDNWVRVAFFASAACAVSAIAVLTGPARTHLVPTPDVGRTPRTADAASTSVRVA